ncbi:MAG TPA: hypothetical protein VEI26_11520 [Terriglobales bacterium]|nr:hypothetical protein [Terriglobales bacterium]
MGVRYSLDSSSFEKLLAAAWVLQCQSDKEVSDSNPQPVDPLTPFPNRALESQPPPANRVEPQNDDANKIDLLPAAAASDLGVNASKDLELVPMALVSAGQNSLSPSSPVPPPAAREEAAFDAPDDASALDDSLPLPAPVPPVDDLHALRLIIPGRSLRVARASVIPISLLVLMFAFFLSQLWKQRAAQASQRVEAPIVRRSWQPQKTVLAESPMPDQDARNEQLLTALPSSHLHMTDPSVAFMVEELSAYEIQGLQRQAEYGDQFAASALGMAYETGHSVPQSCSKAAEWIAFAAANGNAAAQYNLGLRYLQADGLPRDLAEAHKWLDKAAANGYPRTLTAERPDSQPAAQTTQP